MPKLPYANNGLEPVISQATIDYHYGKHLQTYVNNLNSLVPSTEFEGKTVEEIVASAPDGAIFNNAGQVLNHTLYFLQFTPKPNKHEPSGKLAEAINRDFGSFENFKKEFNATRHASVLFVLCFVFASGASLFPAGRGCAGEARGLLGRKGCSHGRLLFTYFYICECFRWRGGDAGAFCRLSRQRAVVPAIPRAVRRRRPHRVGTRGASCLCQRP